MELLEYSLANQRFEMYHYPNGAHLDPIL